MKFLVGGYYGFNNIGDEIILNALKSEIKENFKDLSLVILVKDPALYEREDKVCYIRRTNVFLIMKELLLSNGIIMGGGSLIQDITSIRSPFYYLGLMMLVKIFRKKVIVYGQGVGPIRNNIVKKLTTFVFNKADFIDVRDSDSRTLLISLGVNKSINVSSDLTINYIDKIKFKNFEENSYILVMLNPKFNIEDFKISQFLKYVSLKTSKKLIFLPFFYNSDYKYNEKISRSLINSDFGLMNTNNVEEILSLFSSSFFTITGRFHPLLFSIVLQKPSFSLIYDPKMESLVKESKGFYIKNNEDLELIKYKFDDFLLNMNKIIENYQHFTVSSKEKSKDRIELLLKTINK